MLNKETLDWLEERKFLCRRCECRDSCWDGMRSNWSRTECGMFRYGIVQKAGVVDSARFEALVQRRVLLGVFYDVERDVCRRCRKTRLPILDEEKRCIRSTLSCKQMWARILTEKEMDVWRK